MNNFKKAQKKQARHNRLLGAHNEARYEKMSSQEFNKLERSSAVGSCLSAFAAIGNHRAKAQTIRIKPVFRKQDKEFFFFKEHDKPRHKKGTSFKPLVDAGFYDNEGKRLF